MQAHLAKRERNNTKTSDKEEENANRRTNDLCYTEYRWMPPYINDIDPGCLSIVICNWVCTSSLLFSCFALSCFILHLYTVQFRSALLVLFSFVRVLLHQSSLIYRLMNEKFRLNNELPQINILPNMCMHIHTHTHIRAHTRPTYRGRRKYTKKR